MEQRNFVWCDNYWNMNYPWGTADVDPWFLIDIDEAGGCLIAANQTRGTSVVGGCVREVGPYGHSQKCMETPKTLTGGMKHGRIAEWQQWQDSITLQNI